MTLLLPTEFSAATGVIQFATLEPPPQPDPGRQGEDFGKASPTAFVVLLLLFVAAALLVRSMNKHLRRVPESFDDDSATPRREE
ncbi:MAG: hypothetical protein ACRDRA_19905 [Pseudonocardiaceae bacterium]